MNEVTVYAGSERYYLGELRDVKIREDGYEYWLVRRKDWTVGDARRALWHNAIILDLTICPCIQCRVALQEVAKSWM